MKKLIFLALIAVVTNVTYSQGKKSPLEGAWRMVNDGSKLITDTSFQAQSKNGLIKTFSNGYFTFVGHGEDNTGIFENYGAGTYKLNGIKYEEHIMYHNYKPIIGTIYRALDEIRNDTLFHTAPLDINWKPMEVNVTEKYVRLK